MPVIAIIATYNNMFPAFGCAALLLALPYALATMKVRDEVALPQAIKAEN
ncbi:MAG: hypothetical protein LLF90_06730 [Methanomicrobiaceae archaeon]|nr:hypothetical protein [Methanomicrobiaceae archaeon]